MTNEQHLLLILAEECAEVAQRATKAIRFGLDQKHPVEHWNNRQQLERELGDLMAMVDMLGLVPCPVKRATKPVAVGKYMKKSRELGQL